MLNLKINTKKLHSQFHKGIFFRYLIMTLFIESKLNYMIHYFTDTFKFVWSKRLKFKEIVQESVLTLLTSFLGK